MAATNAQRHVQALVRVGRAMSSTADYEQALKSLIVTISELLDVETAGFMLYDESQDELQLQQPAFGIDDPAMIRSYRVPLRDGGNAVRVFLTGEPYLTNDAAADRRLISRYVALFEARHVCTVPLVVEDTTIGVCHAINKRHGGFTGEDLQLFSTIAPLLAVSVQSAVLFRRVREQSRQLERAVFLQRELSRTAFDAPGLQGLVDRLAHLVARPVMLLDTAFRPLVAARWPDELDPDESWLERSGEFGVSEDARADCPAVSRIAVGQHEGGYLAVAGGAVLEEVERRAVEHAATIFALEMLRERTRYEAASRMTGGLLQDLVSGGYGGDDAQRLLEDLGFARTGPWRLLALQVRWPRSPRLPDGADEVHGPNARLFPMLRDTTATLLGGRGVGPWRAGFLVLLPVVGDDAEADAALAEELLAPVRVEVERLRPGAVVHAGLSSLAPQPSDLAAAMAEVERALRIAQRLDRYDRALAFEHLGVYRVLLGGGGPVQRAAFVEDALGALVEHDARTGGELVTTLRTYVEADHVAAEAARRLYVHPNTLAQRLRTIRRVLGGDPAAGDLRLQVELALKLQDLARLEHTSR